ncbi:MAG TPA: S-adenosylmethionine decarboxylase [Thermoanaerobaculia bacterium]|nr:S-adenosylmethionine decarboxylase [Thermoanaerobaculia bacterium]
MTEFDVGVEWIVNAGGCDAAALRSVESMATLFARAIRDLSLHPVSEPHFHQFPSPGGITGFVILAESHLACHTYPEHGVATINLYCCRERPEWDWETNLAELLGAAAVEVVFVRRRIAAGETEEAIVR